MSNIKYLNMEIICILLAILGIILIGLSWLITKSARRKDEQICKDKSLSDEEFEKLREKKVYKPEKWADRLLSIGILCELPNAIWGIKSILSHFS